MDPQLQHRLMLYAGVIPGALALVLLLSAWYFHAYRLSRIDLDEHDDDEPLRLPRGPSWLLPLLLPLGFAGADYAINYRFALWPDDNSYRFTHALALIALMALTESLVKLPLLLAMLLRTLAYAGAFWMLSEGYVDSVFTDSRELIGYTLLASLVATLVASAADLGARHNNHPKALGWIDALTWLLIFVASMPVLFENHFALGTELASGVVSVLAVTTLAGLLFSSLTLAKGALSVLVGALLCLLTGSLVQRGASNLPSVLLIAALPLVTLIPLSAPSQLKRLLVRLTLVAIIGGGANLLAFAPTIWASHNDDQDQSYESAPEWQP